MSHPSALRRSGLGHGSGTDAHDRNPPPLATAAVSTLQSGSQCHIHMLQPSRAVLDNDEHLQCLECDRHGHKKVARQYCPRVVLEKRRPSLIAPRLSRWSLGHVLSNGPWGYTNPELDQQLIGDTFLTPRSVLNSHSANQSSQFNRNSRSAGSRLESPE